MLKLSVILVNYNGISYLKELFDSLKKQTYQNIEYIFVDNGSTDNSLEFTKEYFPAAKIIKSGKNLGFTGGNNLGIKHATGDIIVLLNNDTKVEKKWAEEIAKAFEKDKSLGITASKLTYYTKFVELELKTEFINPKDLLLSSESIDIGATIYKIQFANTDYQKLIHNHDHLRFDIDKELLIPEKYKILVPIDLSEKNDNKEITLQISAKGNGLIKDQNIEIFIGGKKVDSLSLTNEVQEFEIKIDKKFLEEKAVWVVNNAGTNLDERNGWTQDLGIDEIDKEKFDKEKEINAACGCSFAIRKEVIDQIGVLDNIYYTYFEDTDYSWRAENKGWKIKYLPKSIVRHIHSGTSSKKNPELFTYYIQRNRLICLMKNGKFVSGIKAFAKFHIQTIFFVLRAVLSIVKNNSYKKTNISNAKVYMKVLMNIYLNLVRILVKKLI